MFALDKVIVYVCMKVHAYVCNHACMHMYAWKEACMNELYICMHACMYEKIVALNWGQKNNLDVCMEPLVDETKLTNQMY